jgi:acetyl esterase/lipase
MSTSASRSYADEPLLLDDGRTLNVRWWHGAEASGPWVLHLHGGAFVGGSLETGANVARLLAGEAAAVASVEYPLAPAHPFPAALDAGYAALLWLDRRRALFAPKHPLIVAGEDAGGNLAAALAMMARDRAGPQLAAQILLSPMLDACIATASQRAARDGPVGCPCADGWRAYLAEVRDAAHPYAAPGTALRLAGLPPTLLVTARDDPQRDETVAYAQQLRDAGVPTQTAVLPAPTGWPKSYAQRLPTPWAEPVREHIKNFLSSTAKRDEPATTHHS